MALSLSQSAVTILSTAQLQLPTLTAIWAVEVIARTLFHFLHTEKEAEANCYVDHSEACGGPNRLSVYTSTGSVTALPVPTTQTTGLPGSWQYSKCFAYVHFPNTRCRSSPVIRSSVNLLVDAYSLCTRSSSQQTTRLRIA